MPSETQASAGVVSMEVETVASESSTGRSFEQVFISWLYPLQEDTAGVSTSRPRFDALGATRWIASVQIVTQHFYGMELNWGNRLLYGGHWTQYFFMLSGFLLSYAEMTRPPGRQSLHALEYLRRRLVVVYPSYILSVVVLMLMRQQRIGMFEWSTFPQHVLLMQAWLPTCSPKLWGCGVWHWNGESWFMSALVMYWLLLRPISSIVSRLSLQASCIVFACLTTFSWLFQVLHNNSSQGLAYLITDTILRSSPLGYLHVFVGGVVCMRVFILTSMIDAESHGPVSEQTTRFALNLSGMPLLFQYGCCIGYLAYFTYIALIPFDDPSWKSENYYFWHAGGMMPIMALVLLGATAGIDPLAQWVFKSKPFLVLGRISYMQYLFQRSVWQFTNLHLGSWTAQRVYPFILVAVSYLLQRFFEAPMTEMQSKRMKSGDPDVFDSMRSNSVATAAMILGVLIFPHLVLYQLEL